MSYFVNQIRVKKMGQEIRCGRVGWDKWVKIGYFRQFVKVLLIFNRKIDIRDKLFIFKK